MKKLNDAWNRWERRGPRPASCQGGFTLTELMIVIALIGGLAALIGPNIYRKLQQGKAETTKIQMRQLMTALEDFRRECNFYPEGDQGLQALVAKPSGGRECKNYSPEGYLSGKKVPRDGWQNDFQYVNSAGKYVIKSLGADGLEGGDDLNADVTSDNLD